MIPRSNPKNRLKSTRQAKVDWVSAQQVHWLKDGQVDEEAVTFMARGMVGAGLYSRQTPFSDVRYSVRNIVAYLYQVFRGLRK